MTALLNIDDLNDFIAPGQDCILPFSTKKTTESTGYEVSKEPQASTQISLNDCLACSGCITSAESVLISQQSHLEVLHAMKMHPEKTFVMSIAPQTIASFATYFGISYESAWSKMCALWKGLGFTYVLDTNLARELVLSQVLSEFKTRRQPLLSSACPGFICYAEKSHPHLLPFISKTKSPQSITGRMIKSRIENVYHVACMPCFDKKLEAARDDDVDCVITPIEILSLLEEKATEFSSLPEESAKLPNWWKTIPQHPGSSSGGYAHHVLTSQPGSAVEKPSRNTDMKEWTTENGIRVAQCFGFRNIQNLVRKLKRGNCSWDYVEVMACPSGCVNGGGQLRAPLANTSTNGKEWAKKVDSMYRQPPTKPGEAEWAEVFLDDWATHCHVSRDIVDDWCRVDGYKAVEGVVGGGVSLAGVKW